MTFTAKLSEQELADILQDHFRTLLGFDKLSVQCIAEDPEDHEFWIVDLDPDGE